MKTKLAVIILSLTVQFLSAQIADNVFKNAKIYTTNNTFEQAIAIKDGNIIYVGTDAGVATHIGAGTQVEDLAGKLMLPGLHDVHQHPLEAGSSIFGPCALDNTTTDPYDLQAELQACNLTPNSNGWIVAAGHSIFTFFDPSPVPNEYPFEILDDVFPNNPAVIMEETSHSVWVNSAALTALGITAATADPTGGHIVKDVDFMMNPMTPTGILLDNAGDEALKAAFASNATNDALNKDGLVNFSLPLLAENGITSICEGRTYWKRNYHTIWEDIKNDGDLTCRVVLGLWAHPEDSDAQIISDLNALHDTGDDMLRTTQIKIYSDGILINATAAMHDPYDYSWDLPFDEGLEYFSESRLTNLITQLEGNFDFHIHAIGDRGITQGLDAIEAAKNTNGNNGQRHRITHLEVVKASDYPRFSSIGVIADMQVVGDFTQPANWSQNNFLIGASRTNNFIPLKSIHDTGAKIALSSDWDVSSVNPFVGMQNAVTRTPQNLPDIETALKAYTIDAAYVMRQETTTGSLEVGKFADLIVVNQDIFTIPNNQIGQTQTLLTLIAGEEIYRSASLPLPVEMIYFEMKENDCEIVLEWATASEFDNEKFIVERSTNGKYYRTIGEVQGAGNSVEKNIYQFIDNEPFRKNYYRLRQISFDGKEELSTTVYANKNCERELDFQIGQNITNYLSFVQLSGGEDDKMRVQLLSAKGQLIQEFSLEHQNKFTQSPLNVSFLPEGNYFVKVISNKNQFEETRVLVVVR